MDKGIIFNIQRFSIHDGPGIRTVIFLKGCPLKCPWCSNPESIKKEPQIMINSARCIGCLECLRVCPQGAISMGSIGIQIDSGLCKMCGNCAKNCFSGTITLKGEAVSHQYLITEVTKDIDFYKTSGGGVTLSGGEPFYQLNFALELLRKLKDINLHTAVETSGYFDLNRITDCLPAIDLFLFDMKIFDETRHKHIIGCDNALIKKNLINVAKVKETIVRIPLIPGFTVVDHNIYKICEFVKINTNIKEIHLLPYHKFGIRKYEMLNKAYTLDGINVLTEQEIMDITLIVKNQGFKVVVGG